MRSKSERIRGWQGRIAVSGCVIAGLLLAGCSSSPSTSSIRPRPGKTGLTLFSYHTTYGQVVGSIAGIVAYANDQERTGHFVCTSATCTQTWQPWLTYGVKVKAGSGVQPSLIGTVKRPDGTVQMSYGGHPLYIYAFNKHALQANAQGAGGVWYVVDTNGNVAK
jgi:predicted lipoprotein with Yx(FWY)xxD motif